MNHLFEQLYLFLAKIADEKAANVGIDFVLAAVGVHSKIPASKRLSVVIADASSANTSGSSW